MPGEPKAPLMLDDRRRFKSLWKELLYARVVAAAMMGALYATLRAFEYDLGVPSLVFFPVFVLSVVLPSQVAKRGWKVLPLAAALVTGATVVIAAVDGYFKVTKGMPCRLSDRADLAVIFAAVGVAEGLSERSIATTWCGLMGGALSGAAASDWMWFFAFVEDSTWCPACAYAVLFALAHLGVGLSLALGRWVRDIPKRAAARSQSP